jgi:hypothetical protein
MALWAPCRLWNGFGGIRLPTPSRGASTPWVTRDASGPSATTARGRFATLFSRVYTLERRFHAIYDYFDFSSKFQILCCDYFPGNLVPVWPGLVRTDGVRRNEGGRSPFRVVIAEVERGKALVGVTFSPALLVPVLKNLIEFAEQVKQGKPQRMNLYIYTNTLYVFHSDLNIPFTTLYISINRFDFLSQWGQCAWDRGADDERTPAPV